MESNRLKRPVSEPRHGSLDGMRRPDSVQPRPITRPTIRPNITDRPPAFKPAPEKVVEQRPSPQPQLTPAAPLEPAENETPSFLHTTLPDLTKLPDEKPAKTKKIRKVRSKKRRIVKWAALTAVLAILGTGGFIGGPALNSINKVFHGNVISDVTAAFDSTPLKGESTGRVNILLAGDSVDDPNHDGADLTDSILICSIDLQDHTAFLLSIPRDLWVYVPGMNSYQKINAANTVNNFSEPGYPSGGMGELESIIETDFGIPIDYYGLMDYTAFKDAVNAVGGVTITIQSPDPRGLYDPFTSIRLPNGPVALNGQQALNLARARGDGYGSYGFPDSDFDRTEHQRQLFIAVANKAKSLGVLANPIRISDLISTLSNNFQTDLTLQNVLRLIQITKGIDPTTAQSYAFSSTLTSANPNPILKGYIDSGSGEDALIPTAGIGNYGQLEQYYLQLTSSNPIVREAPSVVILNGSDVNGLAAQQQSILQTKNFTVSSIGDAISSYPTSMIVDNTNGAKPNSLKLLQQLYPGSTATSSTASAEAAEAANYTSDFVVILGQNSNAATKTSG